MHGNHGGGSDHNPRISINDQQRDHTEDVKVKFDHPARGMNQQPAEAHGGDGDGVGNRSLIEASEDHRDRSGYGHQADDEGKEDAGAEKRTDHHGDWDVCG